MKKIFNIPLCAALAAMPFAFIPYMKEYVFCGSGAVFTDNLFAGLVSLGNTVSPLICVMLGSNLSRGFSSSADISKYFLNSLHIAMILLGKLVIVPLVGFGIIWFCYHYNLIDRIFSVIVFIIYASPTALQVLMICTVHKNQVDNLSEEVKKEPILAEIIQSCFELNPDDRLNIEQIMSKLNELASPPPSHLVQKAQKHHSSTHPFGQIRLVNSSPRKPAMEGAKMRKKERLHSVNK